MKMKKLLEKEEFTNLDADLKCIKSPLVGTYYSSSTPDSTPYVTVGSKVKKGDTTLYNRSNENNE